MIASRIELLTAKEQCKRIFHGNEWMKEHNYAFQNADTRPRLQRRTQNICFVISISALIFSILKGMVKITSIFGSYRFLRIAWHDIFSLSHHLLASWNLYIPRVAESKSNTHLLVRLNTWTSQRLLNWNPIPKLTIVLIWKTPACLKFGKTSNRAVENLLQRKLWVGAENDANFPVFLFDLFVAQCTLVKCNALW